MRVVDRVRSVVMNESRLHVHSLAQSTKGNIDMSSESKFESIELLEIEIAMDKYRSAVSVRTFEQTTEKRHICYAEGQELNIKSTALVHMGICDQFQNVLPVYISVLTFQPSTTASPPATRSIP